MEVCFLQGAACRAQGKWEAMKRCPYCFAPSASETATFRDYECGASWTEGVGIDCSVHCIERQHERDLRVDDEINRRRHNRHFEPDHFGT